MKIIGYQRVSTDRQADEGYSLEAQRQDIERYCQLYGLELILIISDEGESGANLERDGIKRALIMLTGGVAEGLVVAKLDRLTRSVKDLGYLLETYFTKYALMSVADKIDTSTAAGRLVLNIVVSVSQWEREAISERTKKALAIKKGNGERVGNITYGKRLSLDGIHLEDDPHEAEVLNTVKRMWHDNKPYHAISDYLIFSNIFTRNGKPHTYSAIHRMAHL